MKILVAMDTSAASQAALEGAAARRWPAGTSFEVVSVVEPSHLWTTTAVAQAAAQRAEETVRKGVERLQAKGWEAAGATLTGDPKAAILDRARSLGADFIVVGPHGTSGAMRLPLGSVAATILRYAPCPVAVMRAKAGEKADFETRKILSGTDGSEWSERAARSIAGRPWPDGAEVRILGAVELVLGTTRALFEPPFFDAALVEAAREDAMKRAQEAIAAAREILSAAGLNVTESISVLFDTPAAILLGEAEEWGADLIVVGSHGRRGMERFLLGSVSEATALHAKCAVEVIRHVEAQ